MYQSLKKYLVIDQGHVFVCQIFKVLIGDSFMPYIYNHDNVISSVRYLWCSRLVYMEEQQLLDTS